MEHLNKNIIAYADDFKNDTALNQINLKEKSLSAPGIKTKWVMIWMSEQKKLTKLEKLKELKEREYLQKFGAPDIPKFKTEKEAGSSEEIKKINIIMEEQRDTIRFLFEMCQILKQFGFDISNSIKLIQLEQ